MVARAPGPFDQSLADRMRFARRVAGMTQRDLAAAIGSRVSQVRRYETAAASISASTLLRIAVALDVPVGWLYGIDDSDNWPDTLIASLFQDKQMPALVSAFARIADGEARQSVVTMAQGLSNLSHSRVPALPAPMASVSRLGPGGRATGPCWSTTRRMCWSWSAPSCVRAATTWCARMMPKRR